MSEALYRKYRPQVFGDVVGQEHIERTLKNAIGQDKVSHAYLFTGPRGTGKTTMARILAKALLCEQGPTAEPCGTCPECQAIAEGSHPDVYELDAASRTGVENVREEIISRVNYAPTRGAWKVYIIDEVHMLSPAAFNALLKTLEEPPSHVVFILCTTDPQKVPDTIHSRCQRFDFHRISIESIVARLGTVCAKEGVDFEAEALELIAHRAEGGMRNALTSLEQLIAFGGGHATLEGAQNLLGSLDETDLSDIVVAIGQRDAAACFNWVARYVETGADLAQFVRDLSEHVRNLYLLTVAGLEVEIPVSPAVRAALTDQLRYFGQDRLSRMLAVLDDVAKELRASSNPRLAFEIALTRMIRPETDMTLDALAERVEELEARLDALMKGAVRLPASASSAGSAAPQTAVQAPQGASAPQAAAAPQAVVQAPQRATMPQAAGASVPAPASAPAARPAARSSGSGRAGAAVAAPSEGLPAGAGGGSVAPTSASAAAGAASVAPVGSAAQPAVPSAPSAQAADAVATPQTSAAGHAPARTTASPSVMTASVDLANPATLQRFWHTVTSSLRKANPARGVLFMNARVSAEPDAQGIVITFGSESGFAYNAAQKREVLELLAQTIESVAGGAVPFRLVLAGGEDQRSAGAAIQAPAPRPAPAAPPRSAAPSAASPVSHGSQQQPATPSGTQAMAASCSAPSVPPVSRSANVQPAAQRPVSRTPAPAQPATRTSAARPATPVSPYQADDDQVPLDVYDASIDAGMVDGGYGASASRPQAPSGSMPAQARPVHPAPAQSGAPSASPHAASMPDRQAAAPAQRQQPVAQSQSPAPDSSSVPSGASAAQASASAASSAASESEDDETQRIVDILTESFGEGIKFEELPD